MAQSFRSFSAWTCAAYLLVGVLLMVLGLGTRLVPTAASTLSWMSIVTGVGVVLFSLFGLGIALGRREAPKCPHCAQEISVTVDMLTGRIGAKKPGSSSGD